MSRVNPFKTLYAISNHGDPREKYRDLPEFPRIIDIEPVGLCNFRCAMCPTGLHALGRPQTFMSWDLWKKIVDECAPYGTALRPYGWGEPLLHPKIIQMIGYASARGLLTHLNTNGSKLNKQMAEQLIEAGLSSIKFSFQGVDRETFREMRKIDFFEGVIKAIETMREVRGDSDSPYISASTSITYETPEDVQGFRERVGPLVDHLSIGRTIFDFIDTSGLKIEQRLEVERLAKEETSVKRHPDPCPEVYDKLSIHCDGSVAICCNAYGTEGVFGNVNETSIKRLWRHPAIEAYRERLARKDYDAPLCKDCWDYMDCT